MHGNPLLRVLLLAVLLAVTGAVVSAVARHPKETSRPPAASVRPADSIPCLLTLQLSAPARSVALVATDGTELVAPHRPADLSPEFDIDLPFRDHEATILLDLAWEEPSPNRFLRLIFEPEQRESCEVIQHAPLNMEMHAITFRWPKPGESTAP